MADGGRADKARRGAFCGVRDGEGGRLTAPGFTTHSARI